MTAFSDTLIARCQPILAAAPNCKSEEATKQFMVLPFLAALGYNPFDPAEIVPEHPADFSEKYKNRVDYAICRDGAPIIAIEAKVASAGTADDRGQLRSYFNACPTVKLGILTNGLRYECFADTDQPNMMDPEPFLTFDLRDVVAGKAEERVMSGIADLGKDRFDPANVGTEARRKLLLGAFVDALSRWQGTPSDSLVRVLLDDAGYKGSKTQKVLEESRELAAQAFSTFIERAILRRMGITQPSGEDKMEPTTAAAPPELPVSGVITTETELAVYAYACRRLAFLVTDDAHFKALDDVKYQDLKTTFKVFYRRPQAGVLFNFQEGPAGELRFTFPALDGKDVATHTLADIDEPLLAAFKKQVENGG